METYFYIFEYTYKDGEKGSACIPLGETINVNEEKQKIEKAISKDILEDNVEITSWRMKYKKKIKDLTSNEVGIICKINEECGDCPLHCEERGCKDDDDNIEKYGEEEVWVVYEE